MATARRKHTMLPQCACRAAASLLVALHVELGAARNTVQMLFVPQPVHVYTDTMMRTAVESADEQTC
eukprot:19068-Heterococcus_DN1.PRE.5